MPFLTYLRNLYVSIAFLLSLSLVLTCSSARVATPRVELFCVAKCVTSGPQEILFSQSEKFVSSLQDSLFSPVVFVVLL